jgi:hypothetical protein
VLSALRVENPELRVEDRGAYLRVLGSPGCAVSRRAIEAALGRPVQLASDLELCMPSFRGRLRIDDEHAAWEAGAA